jgi:hypothetical protein
MPRFRRLTALALSTFTVTGCAATMSVGSFVERGVDFARYRTYDWSASEALPTGDPRLEKDPFFQDHVQGAIEKQMAAKGFERPRSGKADLLLHFHANINRRINVVNGVNSGYGNCYSDNCWERVIDYEAGTFVLDIVDARTKRVIWRGWAQDRMEGVLNNQDRLARKINEAVARMLAKLPARV